MTRQPRRHSLAADGGTTNRVTPVAVRLDRRPATPAQGHRGAAPRHRIAQGVDDLDVATHHQGATGGDRDARGGATRTARVLELSGIHITMVRHEAAGRERVDERSRRPVAERGWMAT